MTVDECLIIEVELNATGANIHDVNEAVTNYRMSVDVANGTAWWIKKSRNKKRLMILGEERAKSWEIVMRKFVATGVFPKKDTPRCWI